MTLVRRSSITVSLYIFLVHARRSSITVSLYTFLVHARRYTTYAGRKNNIVSITFQNIILFILDARASLLLTYLYLDLRRNQHAGNPCRPVSSVWSRCVRAGVNIYAYVFVNTHHKYHQEITDIISLFGHLCCAV